MTPSNLTASVQLLFPSQLTSTRFCKWSTLICLRPLRFWCSVKNIYNPRSIPKARRSKLWEEHAFPSEITNPWQMMTWWAFLSEGGARGEKDRNAGGWWDGSVNPVLAAEVWWLEFHPQSQCRGEKREEMPHSCSLTSIYMVAHNNNTHTHTAQAHTRV